VSPARQSSVGGGVGNVAEWIERRRKLLLLTHVRPDGDAYGSLGGLLAGLSESGKACVAYLGTPLPERYRKLLPALPGLAEEQVPELHGVDGIISLDTANPERLNLPPGFSLDGTSIPVCNLDHHAGNPAYGAVNWIEPAATATAEMCVELLDRLRIDIRADAANWLFAGLAADSGGFRFSNTSARTMRTAARLIDAGARVSPIMDALFYRESHARLRLKARLLETAEFAHGGRLIFSVLSPELMRECGVRPEETEDAIDAIRAVESAHIACLLQPEEGCMRFSLRSMSAAFPVVGIAETLGGGGHPMAAGARVNGLSLADAKGCLIALAGKVLD
jgi:phosphoesterase RecJ-like protein